MWIITDEPVLFNTQTGFIINFEISAETRTFEVCLNDRAIFCGESTEALDFIYALATVVNAVHVSPVPQPDPEPDPFDW